MMKERYLPVMALVALSVFLGADSGAPPAYGQGCPPGQFMASVYTMSTCVDLKYKDDIVEAHGISGSLRVRSFQNMSGVKGRNNVCLRCHRRGIRGKVAGQQ